MKATAQEEVLKPAVGAQVWPAGDRDAVGLLGIVDERHARGPEACDVVQREAVRVHPQFNSLRYGTPTYCQLSCDCAEEIKRGADDASEMGAFHDLFQPQRLANLRARIDEYTPAGMEAGIVIAT